MPAWAQFRMDASRHVSRKAGQSAVAAAAYRSGQRLEDARTGQVHDYRKRYGVVAQGLSLPAAAEDLGWDRNRLWNEAEAVERRADARIARKIELALPDEMTREQRQALVESWATELTEQYGVAVDWAIHRPDRLGDRRNHHAHLMLSTRRIGRDGFGPKAALELSSAEQQLRGLPVGAAGIVQLRQRLADELNRFAKDQGLDLYADPRSYSERGIDLTPTRHVGVHAMALHRQGRQSERADEHAAIRAENVAAILARPERILDLLTEREAVFTRHDMARTLHRYLDDPDQYRAVLARLEASPELVPLAPAEGRHQTLYSTRDMVALEQRMMRDAERMAASGRKLVLRQTSWERLQAKHAGLSVEQQAAVEHVTGPRQLAVIAGIAGGGKSQALAAAFDVWTAAGVRVRGAALAGKAAEELQTRSGIECRTLHALEYGWRKGRDPLRAGDVLVIDEAGMVGSRQMARVLRIATAAGAKVVLVGDARQLQPIEAGAAFRAIAEQVGVVEIETVRRQEHDWAREASQALARGEVAVGLAAYEARGHVHLEAGRDAAKAALVRDYLSGGSPDGDSLMLAHSNADVLDLNARTRAARQAEGELEDEQSFQAERGVRQFAVGDRVVFLRNERTLGVKNGTLGTVERAADGLLQVTLDGGDDNDPDKRPVRKTVLVDQALYADVEHGYAVTLHKAQGATVKRAYLLATAGMDRHLTYVGLTRHRQQAALYGGRDEFADPARLAERLGRARPKRSTLDYAERRGIETERPWIEETLAWIGRGRDRLAAVWSRLQQTLSRQRDARPETARHRDDEPLPTPVASPETKLAPNQQSHRERPAEPEIGREPLSPPEPPTESAADRLRAQLARARETDQDAARQQAAREAITRGQSRTRSSAEELREILQRGRQPTTGMMPENGKSIDIER